MNVNSPISFSLGVQALEKLLSLVLFVTTSALTSFSSTLLLIVALVKYVTQSPSTPPVPVSSGDLKSSSSTKQTTLPKTVKRRSVRSSKSSKVTVVSSSPATTRTTSSKRSKVGARSSTSPSVTTKS